MAWRANVRNGSRHKGVESRAQQRKDPPSYTPPAFHNIQSRFTVARMVLRRVVEHAKTQNWFAVTLDFFIVVVGVFVGIEVANWNQARQDRHEERRYYGQLLVDL